VHRSSGTSPQTPAGIEDLPVAQVGDGAFEGGPEHCCSAVWV
jgi:hypothetical protein